MLVRRLRTELLLLQGTAALRRRNEHHSAAAGAVPSFPAKRSTVSAVCADGSRCSERSRDDSGWLKGLE